MKIFRDSRSQAAQGLWMLRELTFASCYAYSPCGRGQVAEHSRQLRAALKAGSGEALTICVARVAEQVSSTGALARFLEPDDVLVPVPGCTPASGQVPAQLARLLVHRGLGREVCYGLERVVAVRKSGTAPNGSRPSCNEHFESLAVVASPSRPFRRLTLIDDLITKGRTLLGAAMRLHTAHPLVGIRAFALLRTRGLSGDLERLLDPCTGVIRCRRGDAHRVP